MEDLRQELASLRRRMRLQTLAGIGILAILCTAMGGAEAAAKCVAYLVDPDAWKVRTKDGGGVLTDRLVVTTDVTNARIKIVNSNIELAQQTATPTTTVPGSLWYDSNTGVNRFKYYNGTTWKDPVEVPIGSMTGWGTTTAPTDWFLCDGQAISRTTYAALFAVIGTTYGVGDGSTTFNVPNLKGRVPTGRDSGQAEFDNLAETGGEKTHVMTTNEMPAHTHTLQTILRTATTGSSTTYVSESSDTSSTKDTVKGTDSTGGGAAFNNLSPYVVINWIIKAQ